MAFTPQNNKKIATTSPTTTDDVSKNYTPGSQWFNQSTGEFFVCQNSTIGAAVWSTISGGGGGVGSSSTWTLLNADSDLVSSWTNTGTGVFTLDGANPISGVLSYKFVAAAQNDEIKRAVTPIFRNKGKENSVSLQYTMNVLGFEAQIYDTATATIIEQIPLAVSTSSQTLNIPFILKDTSTTVELRMINTHLTNTPILVFDDVEFSDDPFVYKNLIVISSVVASGNAGQVITPLVTPIPFISSINTNNSWNGNSYVVQKTNSKISITINTAGSIASNALLIYVNGIHIGRFGEFTTGNDILSGTYTASNKFTKDDVIDFRYSSNAVTLTNDPLHFLNVTEQWESQHVITPAKSNINNYSARIANNGVASIISQDHDAIASVTRIGFGFVRLDFKIGLFTVPPSVNLNSGGNIINNSNGMEITAISASSVTVHTFNSVGQNVDYPFMIHISAQGADVKNATFLAAIPKRRVAKFEYSNAATIASIVGTVTIPLDIQKGDMSYATLLNGQITLPKGVYRFYASSRTYFSNLAYCHVYDTVANVDVAVGSGGFNSDGGSISPSILNTEEITLNSTTVIELRNTSGKAQPNGVSQIGEFPISHFLVIEKIK